MAKSGRTKQKEADMEYNVAKQVEKMIRYIEFLFKYNIFFVDYRDKRGQGSKIWELVHDYWYFKRICDWNVNCRAMILKAVMHSTLRNKNKTITM
jgi:hypothetical protein